jgi:hypothetical protein
MLRRAVLLLRNFGCVSLDLRTDDALTSLETRGRAPPELSSLIRGDLIQPWPYALAFRERQRERFDFERPGDHLARTAWSQPSKWTANPECGDTGIDCVCGRWNNGL